MRRSIGRRTRVMASGAAVVAAAWGIGHVVGGIAGYVASITVARFHDTAPSLEHQPA